MQRLYSQQPNSSNCIRAFNIVQDSLPLTSKSVVTYSASATLKPSDIAGGLITTTGGSAITLTFASGPLLLSQVLPSSLTYNSSSNQITGSANFGITPNLQSLSTGASVQVRVINAGSTSGAITYSAGDSSFDISGLQPQTQAINTSRIMDCVLAQVNPSVIWKLYG